MKIELELEYYKNPKLCKFCGEPLSYKNRLNKFCDKSCAAKMNNTLFPKNPRKEDRVCLNCGEIISTKSSGKKFCSPKCSSDYRKKQTIIKIESGGMVDSHTFKGYLLGKRGIRCEICGIEEWQNQIVPLVMDHIDGNSGNWDFANLRLVCGNCDMQLPTYKSKNLGNGRYYRRIRYSEGKSF